jgi:hypothetical protein
MGPATSQLPPLFTEQAQGGNDVQREQRVAARAQQMMQAPRQYWQATGARSPVRAPLGPQLPRMAHAAIYSEVER